MSFQKLSWKKLFLMSWRINANHFNNKTYKLLRLSAGISRMHRHEKTRPGLETERALTCIAEDRVKDTHQVCDLFSPRWWLHSHNDLMH
jgi:hypothetical protein